ncbi:MAG: ankyrin repeat domain-containing protein [Oleispira sp.]|nr:ankyrin repeat domain-containing protein [Oleispira sp.]
MQKLLITFFLLFSATGIMAENLGVKKTMNKELISVFLDAVDRNDLIKIKELLNDGASPDFKVEAYNNEPLIVMLIDDNGYSSGKEEIAVHLIEHGVNIDIDFDDGITLLHTAARLGFEQVVKALLDRGIDKTKKSNEGQGALFYAGNIAMLKLLLSHNVGDLADTDNQGNSLLHIHIEKPHKQDLLSYLLTKIDVNRQNGNGETALVIASSNSTFGSDYVELFLKSGANPNGVDSQGWQAIHYGARQDSYLFFLLAENGANVNSVTELGKLTPLYFSVVNNKVDIVKYLLEQDVDVNYQLQNGETALNGALEYKREEAVRLLEEKGAKATSQEELDLIAQEIDKKKQKEAEENLTTDQRLKRAIKVNNLSDIRKYYLDILNDPKQTIDHYQMAQRLVRWTDKDALSFAMENGLDIKAKDDEGFSIIHDAVFFNNIGIVPFLIEQGLDVNAQSTEGDSVYDMTKNSSVEMVELLLKENIIIDKSRKTNMAKESLYARNPKMVVYFINQGYPFPVDMLEKTSFLLDVVQYEDAETLQFLLDNGLDIETMVPVYGDMVSLLHTAIIIESETMVNFILKAGGNPNARNSAGDPIFKDLLDRKNQVIITAFYDHGGDVNDVLSDGVFKKAPLLQVLDSRQVDTDIAKILIERGASIEILDHSGNTPLHLAAKIGDVPLLEIIIASGANVHQLNEDRHAALDIAIKHKHKDAEIFLLKMESQYPDRKRG